MLAFYNHLIMYRIALPFPSTKKYLAKMPVILLLRNPPLKHYYIAKGTLLGTLW